MARMPGATWKPLASNWASQPRMRAHNIICIHTMVGGLTGTDGYFRLGNGYGYDGTESHYGTGGDGKKVQWQDTAYQADANLDGNGEVISVENADIGPEFPTWNINDASQIPAFTTPQVEAIAEILAWEASTKAHANCPATWTCHQVGIPLVLIPDSKPGRRGVGYHRLGVDPYRVDGGVHWSTSYGKTCPGNRRIAQIPQIIARAKQLANPPEDALMAVTEADFNSLVAKVDRLVEVLLDREYPRTGTLPSDTVQEARLRDLIRFADGNALKARRAAEGDVGTEPMPPAA